jgi:hypothetical protein
MTLATKKALVIAWFAVLLVASQIVDPLNGTSEIFPFFDWSLFSGVGTTEFADFVIEINDWNGKPVVPGCILSECKPPINLNDRAPSFYWMVQAFGKSVKQGDADIIHLEKSIEDSAFPPNVDCGYTLLLRRVDPIAFVRHAAKAEYETIARYQKHAL